MRAYIDENLRIIAILGDDSDAVFPGAFVINIPVAITKKLKKTIHVTQQKRDAGGRLQFLDPDFKQTNNRISNFKENVPAMEDVRVSRRVGLMEAPYEWTLIDLLQEKFTAIGKGRGIWFTHFENPDVIDSTASIVNSGMLSVSVPPLGVARLMPITFMRPQKKFDLYVEADDGLTMEVSADNGNTFVSVQVGSNQLVSPTNSLVFRFTNPAIDGNALAIGAIAIFY